MPSYSSPKASSSTGWSALQCTQRSAPNSTSTGFPSAFSTSSFQAPMVSTGTNTSVSTENTFSRRL